MLVSLKPTRYFLPQVVQAGDALLAFLEGRARRGRAEHLFFLEFLEHDAVAVHAAGAAAGARVPDGVRLAAGHRRAVHIARRLRRNLRRDPGDVPGIRGDLGDYVRVLRTLLPDPEREDAVAA